MVFEKTCIVAAPLGALWRFVVDPQRVTGCLPGLEEFAEVAPDLYRGKLRFTIGPVPLRLEGSLSVLERDAGQATAVLRAEARDARIPGEMTSVFRTRLVALAAGETEIRITTEAKILGKLGEFGQPIIKKSAEKYLAQFIANIAQALGAQSRAGSPAS